MSSKRHLFFVVVILSALPAHYLGNNFVYQELDYWIEVRNDHDYWHILGQKPVKVHTQRDCRSHALSGPPREETFLGRSAGTFPEQRLVIECTVRFSSLFAIINVQGIFFFSFSKNISCSETARFLLRIILFKFFGVLEP